jgi:hypothetical protein
MGVAVIPSDINDPEIQPWDWADENDAYLDDLLDDKECVECSRQLVNSEKIRCAECIEFLGLEDEE